MSQSFESEEYWVRQWEAKLKEYHAAPPRLGLLLTRLFRGRARRVLELGAGSCRDSIHLALEGFDCVASDFNAKTMKLLEQRFGHRNLAFHADDARRLPYADSSFDLTFQNGLIVCFENDDDVLAILREQARVTRRWMAVVVHNGENAKLVRWFAGLAERDDLYRIRFYDRRAIMDLAARANIDAGLSLHKFGGPADALYGDRVRGFPNVLRFAAPVVANRLYRLQPWHRAERIMLLAEFHGR